MSIKQQATTSVFWSAVERFSVQGIQFILSIIIARILLPSDYGLIAMLTVFLAIAQVFIDSGFANALTQKKVQTETDYSTVFYFNIVVSVILYIVLYFTAPLIASFYEEDLLVKMMRVVGLTLIINSFGIVQQAKLTIALDFKRQAQASLIAVIISGGIGLWMAFSGYGVWTLVYQSLINNLLRVIILWIYSRWWPAFCFSIMSFNALFAFGSKLLLSSLLHTLYTNLYTLIIGKRFASVELGYYNRAFSLAQFPSVNFASIIVRAMYPIQCRLQDDHEQLCSLFLKYMCMACYLVFPVMIGLCALADPLVRFLLTDKWLPVVPLLQILCIAYMWDPVMIINNSMLNVKGRSDYFLYAEILKKIAAFLILFLTIPFGLKIMCAGLILYAFADMLIVTWYVRKIINISLLTQVQTLYPIVLLSFSMGGIAYGATRLNIAPLYQLLVGFSISLIYYLLISYLFRFREYTLLTEIVIKFVRKVR